MANRYGDTALTRTIASTATIKLASIPKSSLLYTPLEERFERITRLARRSLSAPVAAVTLIDAAKQWFKSVTGWSVSELPFDKSLCRWTLEAARTTVIADLSRDPRTREHALVRAGPAFRFYAGSPLVDDDGVAVGTFCVYDVKPREPAAFDRQTFDDLTNLAQQEFLSDRMNELYAHLTRKLGVARREAMMDALTHLWNRRGASMLLKNAMDRADWAQTSLAVALLDVDNFKHANDTYGHQAGDDVLRRLARRLVAATRQSDFCCRIGGDEFLVIMVDTDVDAASQVAERIRRDITGLPVRTREGAMPVSTSLGYAVRVAGETVSADDLIKRADEALMRSKKLGRNRMARSA